MRCKAKNWQMTVVFYRHIQYGGVVLLWFGHVPIITVADSAMIKVWRIHYRYHYMKNENFENILLMQITCCSRKYPSSSYSQDFFHIWDSPPTLEFPITFFQVGVDISWNHTIKPHTLDRHAMLAENSTCIFVKTWMIIAVMYTT